MRRIKSTSSLFWVSNFSINSFINLINFLLFSPDKLIISDPVEFHDRTFLSHLNQLPWKEPLFTQQVETTILNGKHMLFCRVQGDSVTPPTEIINFPNFTKLKMPPSICPNQNYLEWTSKSATMKPIKLFCIISSLLLLYTELSR